MTILLLLPALVIPPVLSFITGLVESVKYVSNLDNNVSSL